MNGDGADSKVSAFRDWVAQQSPVAGLLGHAALCEGIVAGASKKTWIFPGKRESGIAILRGCEPGRANEARPYRVVPSGQSPSIRALQAVGVALAGEPALVIIGAGGSAYGVFHEALQLAAAHQAPVTFVVSWYTGAGPFAPQLAVSPSVLAKALGMGTAVVDGGRSETVRAAVVALAGGPGLIQAEFAGRS